MTEKWPVYNLERLYVLVQACKPDASVIPITKAALGDYFILCLRDRKEKVLVMYNKKAAQSPTGGVFGDTPPYYVYVSYATAKRNQRHGMEFPANKNYGMAFPENKMCSVFTSSTIDAMVKERLARIRIRTHLVKLIQENANHIDELLWRPVSGLMTRRRYQQGLSLLNQ